MIEYKWEPSLRALSPEEFHRAFWALCAYQKSWGTTSTPDASEGMAGVVCSLIVPQLDNRMNGANGGNAAHGNNEKDGNTAEGTIGGIIPPTIPGTVLKDKEQIQRQVQVYDDDTRACACENAPHRSSSERDGDAEDVLRIYGELCPSLVPVKRMSPKLQETLREARTRFGMEELRQLFTKAEATPFLRGEGERGWKASLSWVLDHAEEIMAGSYDTHEKPQTSEAPENWADTWKDWNQKKSDHKENTA